MNKNDISQLKKYLQQILPSGKLEELADASESVSPHTESLHQDNEVQMAHRAVQKLAAGQDISNEEMFQIEAIIIPDKRPAIDIIEGQYSVSHPDWLHYDSDATIKTNINSVIPAIGRVELPDHFSLPYGGTGFIVSNNLMMTNRHVAEIFVNGLGQQGLRFISGQTAGIDLIQERDSSNSLFLDVAGIKMVHPYWDMALLEISNLPSHITPLTLSLSEPEELAGRDIAVIGYPAFDPRNNTEVQNRVFGGIYNVKRLMPGKLGAREAIRSYGNMVDSVTHEASTLGGASGSAVADVSSGEIIALHFAGRYKIANYAVPTYELSRDSRVIDTGINFGEDGSSNIEDPNPWAAHWRSADSGNEQSGGQTQSTIQQSLDYSTSGNKKIASVKIPLVIDVSIGELDYGDSDQPAAADISTTIEKMVEPIHDDDYSDRPGYDEDFLGTNLPMPIVTDLDRVAKLDDDSHVLDYYHFSAVMDKNRRIAMITAANVDARPESRKPDSNQKYGRRHLNGFTSQNDREKWFEDPRISSQHQLPDKFFNKDRKAFDKGHIVRRDAVAWGESYEEVQFANGDTFHATNCSPQVKGFNRSNQNGIWGKLENHVFKQAETEKLCVFAGPILKTDDPLFSGFDNDGSIQVRIPRAYWKIAVAESNGELQTYAFILEQDLSNVDFEFQLTPQWVDKQVKISELENQLQNIEFPVAMHQSDQG